MAARLDDLRIALAEISDLGRARALLAWDERTKMPPAGAEARAEQLATLARIRHQRLVSDELDRLLDQAATETSGLPYESDEASLVRVARREWEKARRVPAELRGEITRASSLAEHSWVEAKQRSDFPSFLPHLERNVELKRRYAACLEGFDDFEHTYDPLLDDFEPGMRTAEVAAVLSDLRSGIQPLVAELADRSSAIDDAFLHGHFPRDAQARLAREVVEALPLEEDAWRLDPTVHPFATAIAPSDIRITTRFDERYVGTALWAVIHEAGHGLYENGIARELRRSPLARPVSLGFHESQSRMWENWVGRGRPFVGWLHPRLRRIFPEQFGVVDPETLHRAANKVQPSLIRVEADQVTYNLHIMMRFELEVELFEGRLELADLPEAWNARIADLLGIQVPDDARGVLQDVHWAAGSFGYFPTYSLGNVIAAQIWDAVRESLPDLDGQIASGEFAPLRDWLREHLYRHGAKFMPKEMLERLVGRPIDVAPYLRQLRERTAEIYGV
ncbi:MAG TPA: carboxypeptidase M32 [Solirubrobacterales bacterium]|nr:carboxypeptidase M32 [Solirubrobacterales bacterium]